MTAGGDKTPKSQNHTARTYFDHSSAQRINTDAVIVDSLRSEYPSLHLTVVPQRSCNLISYASSGNAGLASIDNEKDRLRWNAYIPPATRLDGSEGAVAETVKFGKFLLDWEGKEFVVLVVEGRDGAAAYPNSVNQYILSASTDATDRLLLAAGKWSNDLHGEIWVFDGGYWQKSAELWDSVAKASWDDVILDADMKESIRLDVDRFFSSRETYQNLKVPWKRGIIYYGPPGNGKTISIKATMHTLYERKDPIPTLYVRSLSSFAGPEYSINQIFSLARRTAPCYLVFEDLDTIVSDNVRSYFLNEVDGIKRNDGILMLGSTNHLDRLDPGISKRPSRFDRKYLFPNPDEPQRVQYAHYWQKKLESNKEIEFPDVLCEGIASITGGFSFAYIQEAMVASLLAIAAGGDKGKAVGGGDEDLEKLVLWREIKKQVKILRDEMGDEDGEAAVSPAMSNESKAALKEMEVAVQDIKGQLKILTQDLHIVRQHVLHLHWNEPTPAHKLRAIGDMEHGIKNSTNFVHSVEDKIGLTTEDGELLMREENQDSIRIIKDGIKRLTDDMCILGQEIASPKTSNEAVDATESSSENTAALKEIQGLKVQIMTSTDELQILKEQFGRLPRSIPGLGRKQDAICNLDIRIRNSADYLRTTEEAINLVTLDGESHLREENQHSIQTIRDRIKRLTDEMRALEQEMASPKISKDEVGNEKGQVDIAGQLPEQESLAQKEQQDEIQRLKDQIKEMTSDMQAIRANDAQLQSKWNLNRRRF